MLHKRRTRNDAVDVAVSICSWVSVSRSPAFRCSLGSELTSKTDKLFFDKSLFYRRFAGTNQNRIFPPGVYGWSAYGGGCEGEDTNNLTFGEVTITVTSNDSRCIIDTRVKTGQYQPPTSTQLPSLSTSTQLPPPPTSTRMPPSPTETFGCPGGCTYHPPGCDIKGNVSFDSGERIFHVPGQQYYGATIIRSEYGERWFCTSAEARAAGWRASLK